MQAIPPKKGEKMCFQDMIHRRKKQPTNCLSSLEKMYSLNKAKEDVVMQKADRTAQEQRLERHKEQKEQHRISRLNAKEDHFYKVDTRARKQWHDELETRYQTNSIIKHRQGVTTLNRAARVGEVSNAAKIINRARCNLINELKSNFDNQASSTIDYVSNRSGVHPPNSTFSSTVNSKRLNTSKSDAAAGKALRIINSANGSFDELVAQMPSLRCVCYFLSLSLFSFFFFFFIYKTHKDNQQQSPSPSPQKSFAASTSSSRTYGKLTKEIISAAEEWLRWDRCRDSPAPGMGMGITQM